MKNETLPRSKYMKRFILSFFSLSSILLSLMFVCQNGYAQQVSLSLADLLVGLRSKKATLPERNSLLTDAVKKRGITFSLTPEIEKELETTGAEKPLIEALREKSQLVKVAATPTPKPEPIPVSTPKPPDFSFYQNRANAHFVKGEFDLAVINYNKVIELNPKEISSYMSRGLAYYNKEYFDKAIADYGKVIELNPEEVAAYFKRGETYEKMGDINKAATDYQKVVELDPTNLTAKSSLQRLQAEQAKLMPKPKPPETNSAKNTDPNTAATDVPQIVNVGSLKDSAVKLAMPVYPIAEKLRKTQGLVTVEIMLDEEGKVISADATDGPKTLRLASEDAARKSKFKPAMVGTTAVKSKGFITYNFKAQ
jgi:tetratricopeptide (TPR) repeat protein